LRFEVKAFYKEGLRYGNLFRELTILLIIS
jgi:hypothetical protein